MTENSLISQKINLYKYKCDICFFKTDNLTKYNIHNQTQKHLNKLKPKEENIKTYNCEYCEKQFKQRQYVYTHKKICKLKKQQDNEINEFKKKIKEKDEKIEILEKENKNIIVLQEKLEKENEEIQILQENQEKTNQLLKKLVENPIATPIVNQNTTNNFNLNVFLNETCKNATSIQDFLMDLQKTITDKIFEDIFNKGYNTASKLLVDNTLDKYTVTTRPIHTSNIQDKTVYIKYNKEWKKDNLNKVERCINKALINHCPIYETRYIKDDEEEDKNNRFYDTRRLIYDVKDNPSKPLIQHLINSSIIDKKDIKEKTNCDSIIRGKDVINS